MTKLRVLDLFSGLGAFTLGLERSGGFAAAAFCEIEEYPRRILRRQWPEVPIYDDVRTLSASVLERDGIRVDVIAGGFPCQDLSVAGKGAGLSGEQSSLWHEYARLIREVRPQYVLVENVAALLGRGLGDILGHLAACGYDAVWDCIPASFVGAPHNRDRLWLVAYPQRDEQSRQKSRCWPLGRVGRFEQPVPWDEPWESALSRFRGMDDGSAGGLERADCLRNGLVPQIPEMIGRAIMEAAA